MRVGCTAKYTTTHASISTIVTIGILRAVVRPGGGP